MGRISGRSGSTHRTVACALALALAWLSAPARAAPPIAFEKSRDSDTTIQPWAAGISEQHKARALEWYEAGNRDFMAKQCAQAVEKYEKALVYWDHPGIRYNLAICFIDLGQLVEARNHLERSLAYDVDPLGSHFHREGLLQRQLLDKRLARVRIVCSEPRADVMLDGKLVLVGPGVVEQFVLPGKHHVVAMKTGFLTAASTLVLAAGRTTSHDVEMTASVVSRPGAGLTNYRLISLGTVSVSMLGIAFSARRASEAWARERLAYTLCPEQTCMHAETANYLLVEAQKKMLSAKIAAGVAAAAGIGTGVALWFAHAAATPRPQRTTVAPSIGSGHLELVLTGRF